MAGSTNHTARGLALLGSFTVVFILIFMPWYGKDQKGHDMNGLEFSDDLFNKLSKGSSYFIPKIREDVAKFDGTDINVEVALKKPENAARTAELMQRAGLTAEVKDGKLVYSGKMGLLFSRVLQDADDLYNNDAAKVGSFYGMDGKSAVKLWHEALSASIKALQKQKKIEEASAVNLVVLKGIEPGYNFYGIPAESVGSKAMTLVGLLVFYVIYTLWYGFGIFELFEGIGLSMKKSKAKKEV